MAEFIEEEAEMTAGQMLRAGRTTGRRKRELNTVARLLCIREEFLGALENDDFGKIPELVYILGFARNYAMELDLDPYVVVEKIKKQMGLIEENDAIEIEGEDQGAPALKNSHKAGAGLFSRKNRNVIAALLGLAALGAAAAFILERDVAPAGKTMRVAVERAASANASKYNLPVGREYGARNRDYAPIVLQAVGTTWIQIKNAAGTVVFEHSMVAGDVYYALSGSIATIGNAGALDVWVGGREIPKLGTDHQRVLDILLTPENLTKIQE